MFPIQGILPPQTIWLQFESRHWVHLLSFSIKTLPVGPSLYLPMVLFCSKLPLNVSQLTVCTFRILGVASRVPSFQATLPPSPQIFSVISDTSCNTPYLFFKNTNCVTPPQTIFANLRRFPPKLRFPKNFDL